MSCIADHSKAFILELKAIPVFFQVVGKEVQPKISFWRAWATNKLTNGFSNKGYLECTMPQRLYPVLLKGLSIDAYDWYSPAAMSYKVTSTTQVLCMYKHTNVMYCTKNGECTKMPTAPSIWNRHTMAESVIWQDIALVGSCLQLVKLLVPYYTLTISHATHNIIL